MPHLPPPESSTQQTSTERTDAQQSPSDTGGSPDTGGHNGQKVPDVDTVKSMYASGEIGEQEFEVLLEQALDEYGLHSDDATTVTASGDDIISYGPLWWATLCGLCFAIASLLATFPVHHYYPSFTWIPLATTMISVGVMWATSILRHILEPDHPLAAGWG